MNPTATKSYQAINNASRFKMVRIEGDAANDVWI